MLHINGNLINTDLFRIQPLLTEREVADITTISVDSLRHWRATEHSGPRYIRVGATLVLYRSKDVEAWLSSYASAAQAYNGEVS
jgi:predicted DNA-binding transcriptional regulator AlpA